MRSTVVPVGVGDRDAQSRFLANYREFFLEHPLFHNLLEKVDFRKLPAPPQEEVDSLLILPETIRP